MFENFNQEGKGISKDAPPKKGIFLFIDIINREFWSFLIANILFIIGCIPIVTIGASYAALNSIIIKMIRDKPLDIVYDFKTAFKENFVQGTICTLITIVISIILVTAYNFYFITSPLLSYIILFFSFLLIMINNYVFPLIASVELKTKYIYRNCINLMIICLPYSIVGGLLGILLFGVCFLFLPSTGLYILLFGFSFSCFVNVFFTYNGIKNYVEQHKEI